MSSAKSKSQKNQRYTENEEFIDKEGMYKEIQGLNNSSPKNLIKYFK